MKYLFFLSCLNFCVAAPVYSQNLIDNLGEQHFEIGFQSLLLKDYSRNYGLDNDGISFRPIQVNMWYPTAMKPLATADNMPASKYLIIKSDLRRSLGEFTEKEKQEVLENERQRLQKKGNDKQQLDSLFEIKSAAILNAVTLDEGFPLIIFSPSMLIHSVSNVRMCEYLASQGYIVTSCASYGIDKDLMTTNFQDLDNQARDCEFILNYILNSGMKVTNIGLLGHSWGAMAAVLVASRSKSIGSVCSLDGSEEQWKELILRSPSFEISNFQTPYLRLALSNNIDFGFFASLRGDKVQVEFSDSSLNHFSFVSRTVSSDNKSESYYKIICNIVLQFFNTTLKQEEASWASRIDQMQEQYESDMIEFTRYKESNVLSSDQVLSMILSGQIDDAIKILGSDEQKLSAEYLIEIGEYILWTGKFPAECEQYFSFVIELFPDSYQAYEMLGHVNSWLLRDDSTALKYYSKAFELSGGNLRIEQSIKELRE